MLLVSLDQLKRFAPAGRADVLQEIAARMSDFEAVGITTRLRFQHFITQAAVETQGLTRLEENLNYSAKRLTQVWPKRFPNMSAALPYANNPQALANKTYGGRLGNKVSGDGWLYRGSGIFDTTGRENYAKAGYEDHPELLRQPKAALSSALKYWSDHNLNPLADADNVKSIRIAVQGGNPPLGLDDAIEYLQRAKKFFV